MLEGFSASQQNKRHVSFPAVFVLGGVVVLVLQIFYIGVKVSMLTYAVYEKKQFPLEGPHVLKARGSIK